MPVPKPASRAREGRPILGHVNLMVDTFLANVSIDDLRAIVRNVLASDPTVTSTFALAARQRLTQTQINNTLSNTRLITSKDTSSLSSTNASNDTITTLIPNPPPSSTSPPLFQKRQTDGTMIPGPELGSTLVRARSLYGVGLGLDSLRVLASVVRATIGFEWKDSESESMGIGMEGERERESRSPSPSSESTTSSISISDANHDQQDQDDARSDAGLSTTTSSSSSSSSDDTTSTTGSLISDSDNEEANNLELIFAEIDADISQALQSTREELESGRVNDKVVAKAALTELRSAVEESQRSVEGWGGVYPFERAAASLEFWKL